MVKKRKSRINTIVVFIIIAVIISLICIFFPKIYNKLIYPTKYNEEIIKYSKKYEIPASLMFALVKTESNFKENAESHANAKGLAQLTDSTFQWLITSNKEFSDVKKEDIFDPDTNIRVGAFYLNKCLLKYSGDESLALCAYNAGPGRVDGWLIDDRYSSSEGKLTTIPFNETKNYVKKILNAKEKYQKIYNLD